MVAIFRYSLARYRGQIFGWGLGLFLLGALILSIYDTIVEQADQINSLIKNFPPEMMAFFGAVDSMTSPAGYLSTRYFSLMPVIFGIFIVLAGSGMLAGDEEKGTLDLILAHPISRRTLFLGRFLALATATAIILSIAWLGIAVASLWSVAFDVTWGQLILPYLSLYGVVLLFGGLAILLSMLLPSRRSAAMMAGMLLIASYFISSLAQVNPNLESAADFSPLTYYQSGEAILGLNETWLAGLIVVALLLAVVAWWCLERRDIRVAGEGGWPVPFRK